MLAGHSVLAWLLLWQQMTLTGRSYFITLAIRDVHSCDDSSGSLLTTGTFGGVVWITIAANGRAHGFHGTASLYHHPFHVSSVPPHTLTVKENKIQQFSPERLNCGVLILLSLYILFCNMSICMFSRVNICAVWLLGLSSMIFPEIYICGRRS